MRFPPKFTSYTLMTTPPLTAYAAVPDNPYTLSVMNVGQYLLLTSDNPVVMIPAQDDNYASWQNNDTITVEQGGLGQLIVDHDPKVIINSRLSIGMHLSRQYSVVKLTRVGLDSWTLSGDLLPVVAARGIAAVSVGMNATLNSNQGINVVAPGSAALLPRASLRTVLGVASARAAVATTLAIDSARVSTGH